MAGFLQSSDPKMGSGCDKLLPMFCSLDRRFTPVSPSRKKDNNFLDWPLAGPSRATVKPAKTLSRGHITPPILYVLRSRRCRRRDEREETWEEVSPQHHPTRGLGSLVSSRSGVLRPKMDFMHILGQKETTWNTIFSIFERRRGPQTSRSPGKLPPPSRRAWPLAYVCCMMLRRIAVTASGVSKRPWNLGFSPITL